MNKKVQIELIYHDVNGDVHKNFDLSASATTQKLHEEIKKSIPIFSSTDFVFLADEMVNSNNILLDDINIGDIATNGSIKIKVLPKLVDIVITSATQDPKNFKIDTTIPIKDLLSQIVSKTVSSRFILAFESKDKFQVCCQTLPLCAHNWWFNTDFRILRRVYPDDIENATDEESRQFFYKNVKLAINCGISAYPVDVWSQLSSLQIVSEYKRKYKDGKEAEKRIKEIDENNIKEIFSTLTSPFVFEACENILIPKILVNLHKVSQKSIEQAELEYIKLSYEQGSQCSYVEEVKFKSVKKSVVSGKRFIFVSPTQISIYKDYGVTLKETKKLDEIQTIGYESTQTFDILFKDETRWQISHKVPATLRCLRTAIETISHVTEMIDESSKKNEKNDTKEKSTKSDTKTVTDGYESHPGEKLGLFVPSEVKSDTPIEKVQQEEPVKELKDKSDLVIDYIEGPPLTKKTPKTKNKKVKHAVIIPPSPTGEDDNNPRFLDENVLHLEFLEKINVEDFHKLSEKDQKEIKNDQFFEMSSRSNWMRITVFLIILVFGIYQFLLFFGRFTSKKSKLE